MEVKQLIWMGRVVRRGGGLVGDWIDESDAGDMGGKDCEDGGGL